ncbi:hypothetical protein IMZ48_37485, partial [Candidatus Bathyarchaeota archaeon]|nr:hypothetical protein [Candidatus Bathyarchaeota archaeon]
MPRRKSARNAARLASLDGTTASNQVLGKRAASELPEAQECIKVETVEEQKDTGPPDDGRQAREVPCVGCLVGLANWMPEDGEPKLCFDKAGKPPTLFASTYPADANIPCRLRGGREVYPVRVPPQGVPQARELPERRCPVHQHQA